MTSKVVCGPPSSAAAAPPPPPPPGAAAIITPPAAGSMPWASLRYAARSTACLSVRPTILSPSCLMSSATSAMTQISTRHYRGLNRVANISSRVRELVSHRDDLTLSGQSELSDYKLIIGHCSLLIGCICNDQ